MMPLFSSCRPAAWLCTRAPAVAVIVLGGRGEGGPGAVGLGEGAPVGGFGGKGSAFPRLETRVIELVLCLCDAAAEEGGT